MANKEGFGNVRLFSTTGHDFEKIVVRTFEEIVELFQEHEDTIESLIISAQKEEISQEEYSTQADVELDRFMSIMRFIYPAWDEDIITDDAEIEETIQDMRDLADAINKVQDLEFGVVLGDLEYGKVLSNMYVSPLFEDSEAV